MSTAFNPITVEYVASAHSPDYPAPWILDQPQADALAAANVPIRYWKAVGGIATEMTPAEKAQVDADALDFIRDARTQAQVDQAESVLRAALLALLDELNAHANKMNEMMNAVDQATSLADLKARYATIADYPQRTPAQLRAALRNKLGT